MGDTIHLRISSSLPMRLLRELGMIAIMPQACVFSVVRSVESPERSKRKIPSESIEEPTEP